MNSKNHEKNIISAALFRLRRFVPYTLLCIFCLLLTVHAGAYYGTPDYEGAADAVVSALEAGNTVDDNNMLWVNLTGYNISFDESAVDTLTFYICYHPTAFAVGNHFSYSADSAGKYITLFGVELDELFYTMSAEEYAGAVSYVKAGIATIAAQADNSWSDLHKVLFVNDYLCTHFDFDTTEDTGEHSAIRDCYRFLKSGETAENGIGCGVCQAYTTLAGGILDALGVENSFVVSETLSHIWNKVYVGNRWYNADFTWDDPIFNSGEGTVANPNYAGHTYMLFSDTKAATNGHSATDLITGEKKACTDTRYDTGWNPATAEAPVIVQNGLWYYFSGTDACCWNSETGIETSVETTAFASGAAYYSAPGVLYMYISGNTTVYISEYDSSGRWLGMTSYTCGAYVMPSSALQNFKLIAITGELTPAGWAYSK